MVLPAKLRAGTGSGIRGPYSMFFLLYHVCDHLEGGVYHSRWWGAAHPQNDLCDRFDFCWGEGDVRKWIVLKMLLWGALELLQSDARKLAEEQFGEASQLVAQFIRFLTSFHFIVD